MSFKILYAISNRSGSATQLSRFLDATADKNYIIKTAGYRNSNLYLDWTLDAILNMFNPERFIFNNDNLGIYYQQIKNFDPDLIISDLEIFTSHVGNVLDKTVWQVSPLLLYPAIKNKKNLNIYKNCAPSFHHFFLENERLKNIIDTSNYNFVYSHFGDVKKSPELHDKYEWIRPYHVIGHTSRPCEHNIVAQVPYNNKMILSNIKKYEDVVVFSNFPDENYNNCTSKNINDLQEYACNIKNCNIIINQGHTSFLADAFYNKKPCATIPNFYDIETVMNSAISEYYGLSKTLYGNDQIPNNIKFDIYPDRNIRLLHERIDDFL